MMQELCERENLMVYFWYFECVVKRFLFLLTDIVFVFVNGTSLPESTIWNVAYCPAAALKHMHSRGLVHVDIKPENVFMTASGQAKLGDLGLACESGCCEVRYWHILNKNILIICLRIGRIRR